MKSEEGPGDEFVNNKHSILVLIAISALPSWQGLGTLSEGHFDSSAKAPPAKSSEKGFGDENANTPQQCRIIQNGDTF